MYDARRCDVRGTQRDCVEEVGGWVRVWDEVVKGVMGGEASCELRAPWMPSSLELREPGLGLLGRRGLSLVIIGRRRAFCCSLLACA